MNEQKPIVRRQADAAQAVIDKLEKEKWNIEVEAQDRQNKMGGSMCEHREFVTSNIKKGG